MWVWWLVFLLLIAIAVVLLANFAGPKKLAFNQPGLYKVEQVVDGDTIIVDMNGRQEIVRMIGVDTPETRHPDRPIECFGQEATAFNKQLIGSSRVRLQADSLETNRDRYSRLLRYVYLPDGRLVETELIRKGYGFAYPFFPFEKSAEFITLEEQAKKAGLGLWSACQVTLDSNGAKHTNAAR